MELKSIGIVGYGAFGSFVHTLAKRFLPDVTVQVYSSRNQPDENLFFSLEEVCQSDILILCVPIHAFEEWLQKVLPLLALHTVIVDVATVKMHAADLLRRYASDKKYIATHPMFGPESYTKTHESVDGFRIVITEHTLADDHYSKLTSFLEHCGFTVIELSSDKHDQHLSETLFLTHFIGQALTSASFERTEIDTVSFGFLMNAVESVKNDTNLFKDVYRYNPYCKETIARLDKAESVVLALLEG